MATYEEQLDLLLAEEVEAVKERERTAFDRLLAEANGRIRPHVCHESFAP